MGNSMKTMIVIIVFRFSKMIYLRVYINIQKLNKILSILGFLLLLILIYVFRFDFIFFIQNWRYKQLPNQNKIWVHRVNSLERLDYLQKNFDGLEADIYFDTLSKYFIINHPPSTIKNLSIEQWVKNLQVNKKVWFDVKLLDTIHVNAALVALDKIPLNRSECIFECYDLYAAMAFVQKGYRVALNVDPIYIHGKYMEKKKLISAVPDGIEYVSQEDHYVDSLKLMFPNKKIITWSTSFYHIFKNDYLRNLLNDPVIDIVLVNVKSKGYL